MRVCGNQNSPNKLGRQQCQESVAAVSGYTQQQNHNKTKRMINQKAASRREVLTYFAAGSSHLTLEKQLLKHHPALHWDDEPNNTGLHVSYTNVISEVICVNHMALYNAHD